MNHPKKHPLDPGIPMGDACALFGCHAGPPDHCHCDYHDTAHGCLKGRIILIRRLKASVSEAEENDWTPPVLPPRRAA